MAWERGERAGDASVGYVTGLLLRGLILVPYSKEYGFLLMGVSLAFPQYGNFTFPYYGNLNFPYSGDLKFPHYGNLNFPHYGNLNFP